MSAREDTPQARIDHWLEREQEERLRATKARDPKAHDTHVAMAERCADRAWSIAEESDGPFIPSSLWAFDERSNKNVRETRPRSQPHL